MSEFFLSALSSFGYQWGGDRANAGGNSLLPLPQTCTSSMGKLSPPLASLLDALNRVGLSEKLDNTAGVTCFAPTQDSFTAA